MKPHVNGLKFHSKYLHYRFTHDISGQVELHYKKFQDSPWEPNEGGGLKILNVSISMHRVNSRVKYNDLLCKCSFIAELSQCQ